MLGRAESPNDRAQAAAGWSWSFLLMRNTLPR